jgi:peptide/nickel transport system substrate-binding protein
MTEAGIDRRTMLSILAGALSLGGTAAFGDARTSFTAAGRILRVQNDSDIRNLDPANRHGWYDEVVMFAIYSGLCQYRSGDIWDWQLDAAQRLEQIDPVTISFALRPGVLWTGDFGEVTAEDVRYSYERFLDPHVHADYRSDWLVLDRVEVTGRYSGVIHLKQPVSPLFTSTLPHASGLIVCKKAVEAAGGLIAIDPLATSGPYRIAQWTPRERLILARNDKWTGPPCYYDEIHMLAMSQREGEFAFDAGDLDATKIAISSIPVVRAAKAPGVVLTARPALEYHWLGMNLRDPKLADIRLRRAIQHAIDVPAVNQAVFGGLAPQAYGVVPPPLLGARSRNLYCYDPTEARRLLQEIAAEMPTLKLAVSASEDHLTAALVIQAQLAAVGIALEVRQTDPASYLADMQDSPGNDAHAAQLHIEHFTTAPDPSWVVPWFTCNLIGIWNFQRFCDPAWDELSVAAVSETDPARRAAIYEKLQDQLEESGGFVFLYYGVNAWLTRPSLKPAWSPDGQWLLLRDLAPADV